jgi:hypothetical protein
VIPSAEAIAEEVMKHHQAEKVQREGTCMIRENWKLHSNQVDMLRGAGLAYYDADDEGGRMIYYPVCKDFGASRAAKSGIHLGQRRCDIRKSLAKHSQSMQHVDALEEREKELRRNLRRTRIGLKIARTINIVDTARRG